MLQPIISLMGHVPLHCTPWWLGMPYAVELSASWLAAVLAK